MNGGQQDINNTIEDHVDIVDSCHADVVYFLLVEIAVVLNVDLYNLIRYVHIHLNILS